MQRRKREYNYSLRCLHAEEDESLKLQLRCMQNMLRKYRLTCLHAEGEEGDAKATRERE